MSEKCFYWLPDFFLLFFTPSSCRSIVFCVTSFLFKSQFSNVVAVPLKIMYLPFWSFWDFSLQLFYCDVYRCGFLFSCPLCSLKYHLNRWLGISHQLESSWHLLLNIALAPFPLSSLSGGRWYYMYVLCTVYMSVCTWMFSLCPICPSYYVVSILFALQASIKVFYIYLTSGALMLSSAVFSSLLLNLSICSLFQLLYFAVLEFLFGSFFYRFLLSGKMFHLVIYFFKF